MAYAVRRAAAASRLGGLQRARNALLVAWLLHGAVLVWACGAMRPTFGFAPALSMTAWLVLTVVRRWSGSCFRKCSRWTLAGWALQPCAGHVVPGQLPARGRIGLAALAPLALGIACYGLFAAAVVHAWLMTRRTPHPAG